MDNNNEQFDKILNLVTSAFHEIGCKMHENMESLDKLMNVFDKKMNESNTEKRKTTTEYKSELQLQLEKKIAVLLVDVIDCYGLEANTKYKFGIVFTTNKSNHSIDVDSISLFQKKDKDCE